jgi:hypothetical protein
VKELVAPYSLEPVVDFADLITSAGGSDQIPEIVGMTNKDIEFFPTIDEEFITKYKIEPGAILCKAKASAQNPKSVVFFNENVEKVKAIELIPSNSGFIDFDNALQAVVDSFKSDGEGSATEQEALTMYFVSSLAVGPGKLLRDWLRDGVRYLGPLRDIPPRSYRAPTVASKVWANGAAAWDALALAGQEQLAKVNYWLDGESSLGVGYTVEQKHLLPLDASGAASAVLRRAIQEEFFEDKGIALIRELLQRPAETRLELRNSRTGTVISPCDMGTGISQVIPVVVAACTPAGNALVAVEQPELHIHPKLQVALGDLFIEAIQGNSAQSKSIFLIETHSEHLLLRLLKRIRQAEQNDNTDFRLSSEQLAVWYIQTSENGPIIHQLRIDGEGEFLDRWPDGFFDERAKEVFE